ncbi:MAG TPA: DNA-binding transcriptional regulator [Candidatus Acidoferrum sp.]|nr:DNA-binding transcriptional regulator [Candidatus Acidoferrum sp.]
MVKRQKRVLLALGWYDYHLHQGIEKFARENGWHVYANLAREKVIPWGWEGDGVLAWLGAGDDLAEFVQSIKKPTVDFSLRRPQLKFPRVLEDHTHAAQLVAEHFLSRGFAHFAFFSDTDNWSYEERGEGFLQALKRAGRDATWLRWNQSGVATTGRNEWSKKRKWLAAEMKRAPKPLAVFAANDQQALDVLESCESVGINVPEQVAIIGAENYLPAPEAMRTPISSVDTNLEMLGYRGAQLLEDLMNGKPAPPQPVRVPAAGIIARKSSDILTIAHRGVARSLRHIWEHSHEPICVKDLVGVAGMSRRGLHMAFWEHLGRTPGQELQRVRIDRAKQLLGGSDHKIETISSLCGYQSANSFCIAFKRVTGMSAKQFRGQTPAFGLAQTKTGKK